MCSSPRSSPVAVGPGCVSILPDLISANPSPNVWPSTPAALKVLSLVSFLKTSALLTLATSRLSLPPSAKRLHCGLKFGAAGIL